MTTAVCVVRVILAATVVPTLTEGFFTVEENKPVSHLWFFSQTRSNTSDFQNRGYGRCRIICTDKLHVLVELRIVMTGDQNHPICFTRNLADDVDHLLVALGRARIKFI